LGIKFIRQVPFESASLKKYGVEQVAQLFGPEFAVQVRQG
jgi:hypothetical protein